MAKKVGRPERYTANELLDWVVRHYRESGEVMNTAFNIEPKKATGPTFTTVVRHLGPSYGSIQNMLLAMGTEPTYDLCRWPVPDQNFPLEPMLAIQDASFEIPASAPDQIFQALQPYEGNLLWRRPADRPAAFSLFYRDERCIVGLLDPKVEYVRSNSASRIWRVSGEVEYPPHTVNPPIPTGSTAVALQCFNRENACIWGRLAVAKN